MNYIRVELYDLVEMKKPHPCHARSKVFQVVRLGVDLKIQCQGCGNVILMDRDTFNRRVKKFLSHQESITFKKA